MDPFRGRAPRDLEAVLQFHTRAPIPEPPDTASGCRTAGGRGDSPARPSRQETARVESRRLISPCLFRVILAYTTNEAVMNLAEHPTVQRFHEKGHRPGRAEELKPLDAAWLRQLCLDCGADDAGLV